jgi:prephenate dehydrogenase
MTVQITIIGLGQIGTSIGLALGQHKDLVTRVGHDRDHGVARRAKDKGALDRAELNIFNAIQGSDLIILSLPMDQIHETLELIAKDLKEHAVVMDTAPVKEAVVAWAQELLPPERFYVGLTPVISSLYLHESQVGLEAARADLFVGGLMAIVAPTRTVSEAIKLAADLTRLLGASPMFTDPVEIDGLMASTHLLPQLLSTSLLNATIDQPGWSDARKVAGKAYAEVTELTALGDSPQPLVASAMHNRENAVRVLDSAIAVLQSMRSEIQSGDEAALERRLLRARKGRETWLQQRAAGDWLSVEKPLREDLPTSSDYFGRLFGFRRKPKDKQE